jgi:hypothetical protein
MGELFFLMHVLQAGDLRGAERARRYSRYGSRRRGRYGWGNHVSAGSIGRQRGRKHGEQGEGACGYSRFEHDDPPISWFVFWLSTCIAACAHIVAINYEDIAKGSWVE